MLILNSNTISYYFRGDPIVVPRLQALRPAELAVPAIVEYELRYDIWPITFAAGCGGTTSGSASVTAGTDAAFAIRSRMCSHCGSPSC